MNTNRNLALQISITFCLLSFFVLTASELQGRQTSGENDPAHGISLSGIPARVLQTKNPFEGRSDALAAGEKLYRRHCAECHGDDRTGKEKAPALPSERMQLVPPGAIYWVLQNGRMKNGMPSWSRLPEQRLWQIVTYLRETKPAQP